VSEPAATSSDTAALLARVVELLEQQAAGEPEGLDPSAAARFIGVSVAKVHQMNRDGLMPAPAELGDRCPRWARSELKAWLLAGSPSRVRWIHQRDIALRRAG
jgi:predicted DNA-binding transcriptional regulator AlpA